MKNDVCLRRFGEYNALLRKYVIVILYNVHAAVGDAIGLKTEMLKLELGTGKIFKISKRYRRVISVKAVKL